jgi:Fe-S cluster assembly protein SufD
MDQTLNNPELKYQLLADFKHFEDKMNGEANSPIHKIRQDAISVFDKLGFPIKKMEEWKYTNLNSVTKNEYRQILIPHSNKLTEEDIKNLNIPEIDGSTLVLVNGRYSAKLSKINNNDESIFIGSFSEGLSKHNDIVMSHFAKYADYKAHSMTALNTAFANDGVFIYVPKNKTPDKPILIVNIADSREENILLQPRNLFVLEEDASASISEITYSIGDKPSLNNTVTEIVVSPNARLDHHRIQNDSHDAYNVNTTQVNQSKDSYYSSTVISWGGAILRNDLNSVLSGENGECHFYGLYLTDGREHVDNHTLADHAVPNCFSNELYKGIMGGESTGVFNGKIMVRPDAQKTNAYQSNNNILVSENATINTKPQLEIFADDVKCSHGATIGQLDENALFYLRSRGINENDAKNLLLFAFASDVMDSIKNEEIRDYVTAMCHSKIDESIG